LHSISRNQHSSEWRLLAGFQHPLSAERPGDGLHERAIDVGRGRGKRAPFGARTSFRPLRLRTAKGTLMVTTPARHSSAPARAVAIVVAILAADIRVGRSDVKSTFAEPAMSRYWDRYNASRGEGGGSMDMPRKSAVSDCAAGRTEAGIRTMEELLRRNGYAVPPP
jgi:hypothetical protein